MKGIDTLKFLFSLVVVWIHTGVGNLGGLTPWAVPFFFLVSGFFLFGKLFRNFGLKLMGVALGAVIYYIVIQIVLWLGLNTNLLKLLSAAIVAVFLGIPYWKAHFSVHSAGKGGRDHA